MKNSYSKIWTLLLVPFMALATVYTPSTEAELEAITSLVAGDTVKIQAGYYSDVTLSFAGNGAEGDSVVVMAEDPGKVIFNGESYLFMSGDHIKVSGLFFVNGYSNGSKAVIEMRRNDIRATHSRITECAILNYNPDNKDTDYKWISVFGNHNRVDHCHFEGKTHSGTTFVIWLKTPDDRPNYHRVDHNYFGPRPDLGYNGGETIRIGTSDYSLLNSNTIVEYNVFDQCNGETEIISNKSCENIYRHNTYLECQGTLTLRHGRRCLVDGNFFFGNNQNNTGGIRIIGEDHVVINNYLQDLAGSGYKSGITIVRGVEDSPLNRYYPVERAIVANNTLVNVRYPFNFNYGASDDQSVAPDSCVIVNNAIDAGASNDVLHFDGPLNRFTWAGNIFWGDELGETDPGGISWEDPDYYMANDGMYRPSSVSPLIDAGASGYVSLGFDMDGHSRGVSFDVGADEVSADPVVYRPLSKDDVGCSWNVEIQNVTTVEAGENTLRDALDLIAPGDSLELITRAGVYTLTEGIDLSEELTLFSHYEGDNRPVISCNNSDPIFTLYHTGRLYLKNIILDGKTSSGSKETLISHANYTSGLKSISVDARNCLFEVSDDDQSAVSFMKIEQFVRADSLIFNDCEFKNFSDVVFDLDDVVAASGDYRASNIRLYRSTFWSNTSGVISVDAGDSNPFTLGPSIIIDQCTMDNCATSDKIVLNLKDVDAAEVHRSIISNSSASTNAVTLYGWAYMDYSSVYNSNSILLERGATASNGILNTDPNYVDAANGDFTLPRLNPCLKAASDGSAIGDPRWVLDYTAVADEPLDLDLDLNLSVYPNPTNAMVKVDYDYLDSRNAILNIYNIHGKIYKSIELKQGSASMLVNLENMNSGLWIFQLTDGLQSKVQKVMVIK